MSIYKRKSRLDRKLTITRTELEDWVIRIWVTRTKELKVTSQYTFMGRKHSFETSVAVSLAVGVGETAKFDYFLIENGLYLHLPQSDDSFHILLSSAAPEVAKIPSSLFMQLDTQFSKEKAMESELADLRTDVELLQASVTEKYDIIAGHPKNVLSALRNQTNPNFDFTLVCTDNVWVGVHRIVLTAFWSFFETLLEEKTDDNQDKQSTLKLNYDSNTVEILVSYLYGEKTDFDCQQALTLLNMCEEYKLDVLAAVAFEVITASEDSLKMADCIKGWKSSRQNGYAVHQKFFAEVISKKTKAGGENGSEKLEFRSLTQEETLELFFNAMGC